MILILLEWDRNDLQRPAMVKQLNKHSKSHKMPYTLYLLNLNSAYHHNHPILTRGNSNKANKLLLLLLHRYNSTLHSNSSIPQGNSSHHRKRVIQVILQLAGIRDINPITQILGRDGQVFLQEPSRGRLLSPQLHD